VLEIKQKFHLQLPHLPTLRTHALQFSMPEPEDDELIEAIDDEMEANDDDWQLAERPDTKELVQYWDKVEDDIQHDPKWIQIEE
jgi:hypothetical protein